MRRPGWKAGKAMARNERGGRGTERAESSTAAGRVSSHPIVHIRRRQREDPGLTQAEIEIRAGYTSTIALQRAVGLAPSARIVRRGKEYPSALRTQIDVAVANKIVRALGFAPHEVPGL